MEPLINYSADFFFAWIGITTIVQKFADTSSDLQVSKINENRIEYPEIVLLDKKINIC